MLRFDRLVRLGTAPAARWLAAAVVAALLAGPAAAQDSKISVTCSPTAVDGKAKCELRTNEATTIKQVKVSIKGGGEALDAKLEPFNYRNQGIDILFMIQRMDPDHAKVVTQMGEAAIKLAGEREGKRRFGAAAFANDLDVVAPLSSARSDFESGIRGIKARGAATQLYKLTSDAIDHLVKEGSGNRRVLVILGDGSSSDTTFRHDEVVKKAKDNDVAIYTFGYPDTDEQRPSLQTLIKLSNETAGAYVEAKKQGKDREIPKDVYDRFIGMVENGGTLLITPKDESGQKTLNVLADFSNGKSASVDVTATLPAVATTRTSGKVAEPPAPTLTGDPVGWVKANPLPAGLVGGGLLLTLGLLTFVLARGKPVPAHAGYPMAPPATQVSQNNPTQRQPSYGWLEMLDGNATPIPLRGTNLRIGRHQDNDICLQNNSVSRRHAVLHYKPDMRSFVITNLGTGNGVIVNKVKKDLHELHDGDLVELGEVRLRFHATEAPA